jgi:hypothetical protein
MENFSEILGRLKHELRVSKDQEIADFLGMSKSAFAERKRRGAFPAEKLHAAASDRPELKLDADYVLTGVTREAHARLAENRAAGERRAADGGDFRAGWQDNDRGMSYIQRALEVDRDGFAVIAQAWSTLPADARLALVVLAKATLN